MDNLVSVPVTNPCSFLKQQKARPTIPDGLRQVQRDDTIKSPDPPVKTRRPAKKTQRDDTIKSPYVNSPVKPKRPVKPSVARKLAQEWLEF